MSLSSGCCCFRIVETSEIAVIERFGKYERLSGAGLVLIKWPLECVAGLISLKVQEITLICESKTLDNVFVNVEIRVQYQVIVDLAYSAFYLLDNPTTYMNSLISDVVRSALTTMTLDDLFLSESKLSDIIKNVLENAMKNYGFFIRKVLLTSIIPNVKVRLAINDVNTQRRLKEAAALRAEGEKILTVTRAEAACEAAYLSGLGIARKRQAILSSFSNQLGSEGASDLVQETSVLAMYAQYLDVIEAVAGPDSIKCTFIGE